MARRRTAATLAALAIPLLAPTGASAAYRDFRSPTGNVGCAFYSDAETPRFVRCEWHDAGDHAVTLGESGKGKRIHITDTVLNSKAKVLAYGRSTNFGRLRCTSRTTGITCRSTRTDHGFTVSVEKQRVF